MLSRGSAVQGMLSRGGECCPGGGGVLSRRVVLSGVGVVSGGGGVGAVHEVTL